jgi:hypothetical protein
VKIFDNPANPAESEALDNRIVKDSVSVTNIFINRDKHLIFPQLIMDKKTFIETHSDSKRIFSDNQLRTWRFDKVDYRCFCSCEHQQVIYRV